MANIKISELTEADLPLDGTEDVVLVQDGETRRCSTQDIGDLYADPKKEYVAYLSQSGSSNPTATVIKNTLGGTVVWTRSGAGSYVGTLSGAFPSSKTFIPLNYSFQAYTGTNFVDVVVSRGNDNTITVSTSMGANGAGAGTDGLLTNFPIKIEVYP